jgi:hypothetical protein
MAFIYAFHSAMRNSSYPCNKAGRLADDFWLCGDGPRARLN